MTGAGPRGGADEDERPGAVLRPDGASRRRLLRAATSARPDAETPGRAGGPLWPALVVGVLLAAALSGVTALVGASTAPAAPVLVEGDLVVGRTSGARYLDLAGRLHPILNAASARLLTRTAPRVVVVDDAVLGSRAHGPVLGITGAPDDLPARDRLLRTGWIACPDDTGVRLDLGAEAPRAESAAAAPGAAPVTAAVVVAAGAPAARYVLVAGRRFAMPPTAAGALGAALRSAPAVPVPSALLDLFTPGTPLDAASLTLGPGPGSPLPDALRGPGIERVGQLVDTDGVEAVVLRDGLAPLDPFAAAVYAATAPGTLGRAVPLAAGQLGSVPSSGTTDPAPADWPRQLPGTSAGLPCARLDIDPRGVARTTLALRPVPDPTGAADGVDSVGAHGSAGSTDSADSTGSAGGTGGAGHPVDVPPGSGALVRVGPSGGNGPVLLVDGTGTAFPVAAPTQETLAHLGYDGLPVPSVPAAWAALLPRGPTLDVAAARNGPR